MHEPELRDTLIKLAVALKMPTHELLYLIDPSAPGADLVTGVQHLPVYVADRVGTGPEPLALSGEVVCGSPSGGATGSDPEV
ncbi:hypothetical protein [Deinococcus aquatilis]|uniref:hypothetical protein n=1 Tax=Deinococcus aquatilis TaxID=519440 RepID=UPI000375CF04|nr:hypothetical protein [Deinococcus aquatilis]